MFNNNSVNAEENKRKRIEELLMDENLIKRFRKYEPSMTLDEIRSVLTSIVNYNMDIDYIFKCVDNIINTYGNIYEARKATNSINKIIKDGFMNNSLDYDKLENSQEPVKHLAGYSLKHTFGDDKTLSLDKLLIIFKHYSAVYHNS